MITEWRVVNDPSSDPRSAARSSTSLKAEIISPLVHVKSSVGVSGGRGATAERGQTRLMGSRL